MTQGTMRSRPVQTSFLSFATIALAACSSSSDEGGRDSGVGGVGDAGLHRDGAKGGGDHGDTGDRIEGGKPGDAARKADGGKPGDAGRKADGSKTGDAGRKTDGGNPASRDAAHSGDDSATGTPPAGLVFSPYKDITINMNWTTNVASTMVSGTSTPLATDAKQNGASAVTLAFATGECGSENWGGVPGATAASANVPPLTQAGLDYIVSTGGSAGVFTCGTDSGMETFITSWASSNLIGVDFDIEAGQSQAVISALLSRIQAAHANHPELPGSVLTLGALAPNNGSSTSSSLARAPRTRSTSTATTPWLR